MFCKLASAATVAAAEALLAAVEAAASAAQLVVAYRTRRPRNAAMFIYSTESSRRGAAPRREPDMPRLQCARAAEHRIEIGGNVVVRAGCKQVRGT
jgi:hypothetical protein